jgi:hypothetical protein
MDQQQKHILAALAKVQEQVNLITQIVVNSIPTNTTTQLPLSPPPLSLPPPAIALTPPPPSDEPIDWITKGTKAVNAAEITDGYKKSVIKTWNRAMEGQAFNPNLEEIWKHLLAWSNNVENDDYRKTTMGEIKSVFKHMKMACGSDFHIAHDKLRSKLKVELEYKQKTKEELEVYKCSDGTYLTNAKLRAFYSDLPDHVSDFHRMLFAFVVFHGNRGEDWRVGYGEKNQKDHGYYDPETATMFVTTSKTEKKYKTRIFKVHPKVQEAIATFHTNKGFVWLMPQEKDATKSCTQDALLKNIQRHFFKGMKNKPSPFGFPTIINLTHLRHLYETHIRYVDRMSDEELAATMEIIGHSNTTSVKRYSEMFRAMHEPESQSQSK